MSAAVYELQGYAIVLDKIAIITRVFESEDKAGFQFNIRFLGDLRLAPQFPTRPEAELGRELLLKALRGRLGE
jgi:hypothetical protein